MEREFSYLKVRFEQSYETLDRDDLDNARMAFYTVRNHVSAAYRYYPLNTKGFPDPAMLRSFYECKSVNSWKSLCAEG